MTTSLTRRPGSTNGLSYRGRAALRQIDEDAAMQAAAIEKESQLVRFEMFTREEEGEFTMHSTDRLASLAVTLGQRNPAMAAAFSEVAARHFSCSLNAIDRPYHSGRS